MSSRSERTRCGRRDLVASYALAVLDSSEAELMAAHLAVCPECQQEYHTVGGLTDALSGWRVQELPLPTPLWSACWNVLPTFRKRKRQLQPRPQ